MQRFAYTITFAADEVDGGFVVTCRDIHEAITQGDILETAIEAALEAAIEMRIEDGLDIPMPRKPKKGEHLASLPVASAMQPQQPDFMLDDWYGYRGQVSPIASGVRGGMGELRVHSKIDTLHR